MHPTDSAYAVSLTDAYLLGVAVAHKARLVTFDHGMPLNSVVGATSGIRVA